MKKLFISLGFLTATCAVNAQIGATAPDFTVTDINGNSHNLYSYLNNNKVVLLDVSATWCGPCWNFHSAHYLEDLYAEFGPNGTNEVVVLFYEGDANTNAADLNGTGSNTQGDWVTGTPYPIVNESPVQLNLNIFAPLGYPTINVICPSDKKIKWDLWDSQTSTTAQSLANMQAKVQEVIDNCVPSSASVEEQTALTFSVYPNPANDVISISMDHQLAENGTVQIFSVDGQLVSTNVFSLGSTQKEVAIEDLNSGVYFVQLTSGNSVSKMIQFIKK